MVEHPAELAELLNLMDPVLNEGVYVFASVSPDVDLSPLRSVATFREAEGVSVIVAEEVARDAGLKVLFTAAWITLNVYSNLHAVGLTAAVSTALAGAGISCNVVAATFHDHVFVPIEAAEQALQVLLRLQQRWRVDQEPDHR